MLCAFIMCFAHFCSVLLVFVGHNLTTTTTTATITTTISIATPTIPIPSTATALLKRMYVHAHTQNMNNLRACTYTKHEQCYRRGATSGAHSNAPRPHFGRCTSGSMQTRTDQLNVWRTRRDELLENAKALKLELVTLQKQCTEVCLPVRLYLLVSLSAVCCLYFDLVCLTVLHSLPLPPPSRPPKKSSIFARCS